MEVLTEVDRERIEALRGRDEFFWLDLAPPSRRRPRRGCGALLGLHALALEDTREFDQRPKLDRYDGHAAAGLLQRARDADGTAIEPVEVHLHISGGFLFTVRRRVPELDDLRDDARPRRPAQPRSTSSTACSTC